MSGANNRRHDVVLAEVLAAFDRVASSPTIVSSPSSLAVFAGQVCGIGTERVNDWPTASMRRLVESWVLASPVHELAELRTAAAAEVEFIVGFEQECAS